MGKIICLFDEPVSLEAIFSVALTIAYVILNYNYEKLLISGCRAYQSLEILQGEQGW